MCGTLEAIRSKKNTSKQLVVPDAPKGALIEVSVTAAHVSAVAGVGESHTLSARPFERFFNTSPTLKHARPRI